MGKTDVQQRFEDVVWETLEPGTPAPAPPQQSRTRAFSPLASRPVTEPLPALTSPFRPMSAEWRSRIFRDVRVAGKGGQFAKGGGRVPGRGAQALAADLAAKAAAAEPEVTSVVSGVVTAAGGRMEGLEFRLKTEESMARKISTKAQERGQTHEEAAAKISDSVRYTAVVGEAEYSGAVRSTVRDLEAREYRVLEMETHWARGDAYNAVHVIVAHPNGTKVELQFHTEASLTAKNQNYPLYEQARLPTTSRATKARLEAQMTLNADRAPIPDGAETLGTLIHRPYNPEG